MKELSKYHIPKNIRYLFLSLIWLLLVNAAFRIAMLGMNINLVAGADYPDILYSLFNVGFLFDLRLSLVILTVPFLLTSVPFLLNRDIKLAYLISNWLIIIAVIINIAVSSADLDFFNYYNSRITNAIFDWTNDMGTLLKVMANDRTYLLFFGIFIIVSGLYIFIQTLIFKKVIIQQARSFNIKSRLTFFFIPMVLLFFGIRGSFNFHRMPLNVNDAYFSENSFLNGLSFNPVFSLLYSYKDVNIKYFQNDNEAIRTALHYLGRKHSQAANPFETVVTGTDTLKPNIIFFLLESMSDAMVSRYNPGYGTTPCLDSLAEHGIVFDNFYSAGIHTYNGIFSSFYGLPAIMHNKPLSSVKTANMKFHGLPEILKEKNYKTFFYVTGSKEFDNMGGFLIPNGFDKVIDVSSYPDDSIVNGWGVSDRTMFNRVLNDCDSLSETNERFFIGLLTISSHEGYLIPDSTHVKLTNKAYPYKRYEFADMQIGKFMNSAKNKAWFKNTVFVFVGDHGQNFSPVYDLCLNYHKILLIIYSPTYFQHFAYKNFGLQQDIYPTLCSLLDFSYVNNSLGVNLFKHKRQYAYFTSDNKLGVLDDEYFLIYRNKNNVSLYKYKNKSLTAIYNKNKMKADSMKEYAFSMLQSAQYLIDNKLTDLK